MPTTRDDKPATPAASATVEDVQISGHIIDSLILPKMLDLITAGGGTFRIKKITIGQGRSDPSYALIEVQADTPEQLAEILAQIGDHGAVPTAQHDCLLVPADIDGTFPEAFYSTTNQRTEVRIGGRWIEVADQEMDCGVAVDLAGPTARCVAMTDVAAGHAVRRRPCRRARVSRGARRRAPRCSSSWPRASPAKSPRAWPSAQVAQELFKIHRAGGRTLLVGGPAIIHTGSGPHVCELIRQRLRQRAVRRQRAGHPRHRAGPVRHQPGRPPRAGRHCRSRPRAPPAGHQPHSPRRRHRRGRATPGC